MSDDEPVSLLLLSAGDTRTKFEEQDSDFTEQEDGVHEMSSSLRKV